VYSSKGHLYVKSAAAIILAISVLNILTSSIALIFGVVYSTFLPAKTGSDYRLQSIYQYHHIHATESTPL